MPPKNSKQYEIFAKMADGSLVRVDKVENLTETSADISGEYIIPPELISGIGIDGSYTFSCKFEPRKLYHAIFGNNWLKMHGYPMVRRCGYRKRKRK